MRNVMVYEVVSDEKVRFATISLGEAKEYIDLVFDYTGVKCGLREYQYSPVDHTGKT